MDIEKQFQKDLTASSKVYELINLAFDYDKVKFTEPINDESWLFGSYQCSFYFKLLSPVIYCLM